MCASPSTRASSGATDTFLFSVRGVFAYVGAALVLGGIVLVAASFEVHAQANSKGSASLRPEALAYSQSLKARVKSGWQWEKGGDPRSAQVRVKISPDGRIDEVRVEKSSGDKAFDESVVSSVKNASPVPTAPQELYSQFKDIRFTFDSRE